MQSVLQLPHSIDDAISHQIWRDPGTAAWKQILKAVPDIPDMSLFATRAMMEQIRDMLQKSGYIGDPEFCMVRHEGELESANDPRLVFSRALFVAGSTVPGDDVFVAVEDAVAVGARIVVFDWARPVPNRWVPTMTVEELCAAIAKHGEGAIVT